MTTTSRPIVACGFMLGVMLMIPVPVVAQLAAETRTNVGFRVGAAYSDNLRRDASEESAVFGFAGVDLGISRDTPRTNFNIDGNVYRNMYDSDLVGDETTGSVNARFNYQLVPQVFHWTFANNFGQVRRDPFRAAAPGNREHLNVFSTGPNLFLPLGRRNRAVVSARYMDRRYWDSERLDSEAVSAEAGVYRTLTPTQELGLVGSGRRIEHDNELIDPYYIYSAYTSYSREMPQGRLSLQVGANALDFADRTRLGVLLGFNMVRELTARSTVTVRGRREFQDTSDVFRGRQRAPQERIDDPLDEDEFDGSGELGLTSNPLMRTTVTVGYRLARPRGTVNVGAGLGDEDYQREGERDRRTLSLNGGMSWQFSPLTTGRIGGNYRLESFRRIGLRGHDFRINAGLVRELGQQLDISVDYQYGRRLSGRGTEFAENRASVSLRYTPMGF
jgi:hypothetical protein